MDIGKCNAWNNGKKSTGIRERLGLRILHNTKDKVLLNLKRKF
jgi:hypothetical protein